MLYKNHHSWRTAKVILVGLCWLLNIPQIACFSKGFNPARCKYKCARTHCTVNTTTCTQCATGFKNLKGRTDCALYDIVYNKPTLASPTENPSTGSGNASNVVNGKVITNLVPSSREKRECYFSTNTSNTKFPKWWQVDLKKQQSIKWVTMMIRYYCCLHLMDNFEIHLSNTPMTKGSDTLPIGTSLCWRHGTFPQKRLDLQKSKLTITCSDVVRGRYLIVYVNNSHHGISFCKLSVFQCGSAKYGKSCKDTCTCTDPFDRCNKITGVCGSGCPNGYKGKACKQQCASGTYGRNCSKLCQCQDKTEVCNNVNGNCPRSGCRAGYFLSGCHIPCDPGDFGVDCDKKCHCNDKHKCSAFTGICKDNKCIAGWKSEDIKNTSCYTECDPGTYGENCLYKCRCKNIKDCSRFTGNCSNMECAPGWRNGKSSLQNCQEKCDDGKYGENCAQQCRCQNPEEDCIKSTGECPQSGCPAGYTEKDCQTSCKNGTFGENCIHVCHCKDNSKCSRFTGVCFDAQCAVGWTSFGSNIQNCQVLILPRYLIAIISLLIVVVVVLTVFFLRKCSHKLRKQKKPTADKISQTTLPNNSLLSEPKLEKSLKTKRETDSKYSIYSKPFDEYSKSENTTYA